MVKSILGLRLQYLIWDKHGQQTLSTQLKMQNHSNLMTNRLIKMYRQHTNGWSQAWLKMTHFGLDGFILLSHMGW